MDSVDKVAMNKLLQSGKFSTSCSSREVQYKLLQQRSSVQAAPPEKFGTSCSNREVQYKLLQQRITVQAAPAEKFSTSCSSREVQYTSCSSREVQYTSCSNREVHHKLLQQRSTVDKLLQQRGSSQVAPAEKFITMSFYNKTRKQDNKRARKRLFFYSLLPLHMYCIVSIYGPVHNSTVLYFLYF